MCTRLTYRYTQLYGICSLCLSVFMHGIVFISLELMTCPAFFNRTRWCKVIIRDKRFGKKFLTSWSLMICTFTSVFNHKWHRSSFWRLVWYLFTLFFCFYAWHSLHLVKTNDLASFFYRCCLTRWCKVIIRDKRFRKKFPTSSWSLMICTFTSVFNHKWHRSSFWMRILFQKKKRLITITKLLHIDLWSSPLDVEKVIRYMWLKRGPER